MPQKTRIIIQVQGGCVQSVFATNDNIEVRLCDWDNAESDDDAREECDLLDKECLSMKEVF